MGSVQAKEAKSADAGDHCPVDHKNMSADEIDQMMLRYKKTGHSAILTDETPSPTALNPDKSNFSESSDVTVAESSGCPINHKNMSGEHKASFFASFRNQKTTKKDPNKNSTVYDVYGQELDSANLMPSTPNQLPSPGQKRPLSTDRVKSSIPKSGADDTWTYPSQQMFFNALKRKGKADGVEESDMGIVVQIHNAMNERTWDEVMKWERTYHCSECADPKLKSFMARQNDLSPAARFRTWFRGYPMPFDRHDWIVDRCGEQDVRYVIDYYYLEGPDPIELHVRPALDSFSAAFNRMRSGFQSFRDATLSRSTGGVVAGTPENQSNFSKQSTSRVVNGDQLDKTDFDFLTNLTAADIKDIGEDVRTRCAKVSEAFQEAGDDPEKLEKANVSLNYCMAQRICKTQAADFMSALEKGSDESEAYGKMTSCLERFGVVARRALLEEAGVVQSGPEFPASVASSSCSSRNAALASTIE